MPIDSRIQALLTAMAGYELPPFDTLDAPSMRALFDNPMAKQQEPVAAVEQLEIPVVGATLAARLYRPVGGAATAVISYFHGGGFVLGTLETHDQTCRLLCNQMRAVVVSVAYRLAPENPFPVPLDDCYNATRWVAQQRRQLGVDTLPLYVGGDSAGGNLAAAVCLQARGGDLHIDGQLLLYPVINHDFTTASYRNGEQSPILTTGMMRRFWQFYLKDSADGANPLASPLRAASLAGLPPAYVVTAEFDPLRDEGCAYADALKAAGVPVLQRDCAGMVHGFLGLPVVEDNARALYTEAAAFLAKNLS
jgi:acetyl esterase